MMMRQAITKLMPLMVLFAAGRVDAAQAIVFDFENQTATSASGNHPGSLSTLAITTSGLTMTLSRPGSTFDIISNSSFGAGVTPTGFGSKSLDPFVDSASPTAFVASFSAAVSSFSLQYGDFGGDSDVGTIQAFSGLNGSGTLLVSSSDTYGVQSFPTFDTLGVAATGIRSIVFIGGSTSFPNSAYYDNFTVTPADAAVPEPASLAMLGLGLAGVGGAARMRRRA